MENVTKTESKKAHSGSSNDIKPDMNDGLPKLLNFCPIRKPVKTESKSNQGKEVEVDVKSHKKNASQERAVIEGSLIVYSHSKLGKQKQRYFRLFPPSTFARARLQQHASEEAALDLLAKPELVLLSNDILKIEALNKDDSVDYGQNAFLVQSKEQTLIFSAISEDDRKRWISCIQELLHSGCDSPTRKSSLSFSGQENVTLPRSFNVRISKSTQVRIGDDSPVELVVDVGSISIIAINKVRLVKWPFAMLRRYGTTNTTFWVEAGRHTEAGEGEFEFITHEGEEIHRIVRAAKRRHVAEEEWTPGAGSRRPSATAVAPLDLLGDPSHIYEPSYFVAESNKLEVWGV
ncbi:docking protein 2 [Hyalella azteca]|uniref:Docking protein 2 n=1 Tax=Hyalella azteca TaxID=294128 RepID=A0A8B7P5Y3_HYAAZ|nr:docking protein 2 [Hyalella azteca]